MQLVIISGLSGSGKSVALNVLEDAAFYCVDNLPATLLFETVAFLRNAGYERVAVTVDARSGAALAELPGSVGGLKTQGVDVRLLVLDAKNDALIRRFSETRRRHPLAESERTLDESIARCWARRWSSATASTRATWRPTRCAPGSRISSRSTARA
jgi:UPF0042 nucleotide-binding protein